VKSQSGAPTPRRAERQGHLKRLREEKKGRPSLSLPAAPCRRAALSRS
jgi:hypothetical protein